MIKIVILIVLAVLSASINAQMYTTSTYCPSGKLSGLSSSAYQYNISPVTFLAGQTYSNNGYFQVNWINSADQCCYYCAVLTNGACKSWTFDGCSTCYLSSLSGSSNSIFQAAPKSGCSAYATGFVAGSASQSGGPTLATPTEGAGSPTLAYPSTHGATAEYSTNVIA